MKELIICAVLKDSLCPVVFKFSNVENLTPEGIRILWRNRDEKYGLDDDFFPIKIVKLVDLDSNRLLWYISIDL